MIKLKELLFGKPDCGCGCGNCEGTKLTKRVKISENLQYHLDNKIPLGESIFRISSNAHVKLFAETRKLWEAGKIQLSEADEYFMHTDAGRQGRYKGKLVPLDLPYILSESEFENKQIELLQQILDILKTSRKDGEDREEDIEALDTSIDYLSSALTDKDPLSISIDQGIFGKLASPKKKSVSEIAYIVSEAAKKKKKNPPLNKPKRGGSKAYYVYVRNPKTKKVVKVSFGSGGLRAKISNKKAAQAFAKRHDCKNKTDRTKASYWSCRLPRYAKQLGLGTPASTYW
jgi:hypothetical protein